MFENAQAIYRARFGDIGLEKRQQVWRTLCEHFFNELIGPDQDILDLGCGYGEFINQVSARKRYACDMNPDAAAHLQSSVVFVCAPSTDIAALADGAVDVVFTSNFLEHLPDKRACDATFRETHRVLRPGGRFIALGPNIRYAYKEYWDFYDHYLPLSHLSLAEGLRGAGFAITRNIPRFLPYRIRPNTPSGALAVRLYLKLPPIWRLLGRQFLVIAEKPPT